MNLEKFTDRAKGFLQSAQTVAIRMSHQQIAPEHLLKALLEGSEVDDNPFDTEVPREDCAGARWVRPEVVLEVASLGMTPQKRLRQPS